MSEGASNVVLPFPPAGSGISGSLPRMLPSPGGAAAAPGDTHMFPVPAGVTSLLLRNLLKANKQLQRGVYYLGDYETLHW